VTEILTKEGFSVMEPLICILGGLPKDDRVASFRAHLAGMETAKKLCTGGIARLPVPATGLLVISVDMLVISVVERCFRLGLNYLIPLQNI